MSVLETLTPQARGFSQRIFGDDFHVRFASLIFYEQPALETHAIERLIRRLPNLTTIYIDPTALDPGDIKRLQSAFPDLQFELRPTLIPKAYRNQDTNDG